MIHLRSKKEIKYNKTIESTFPSYIKEDSLKQRVNFKKGKSTYVYKACKYFDWNSKNTNIEEANNYVRVIINKF